MKPQGWSQSIKHAHRPLDSGESALARRQLPEREREDCPCTLPTPRYTKQNARQIIRSSVANRFGHWCPTQTESLAFLCEQRHGEHAGRCVSTCVAHLRRNVDTMGRRNMKIFFSDFGQLASRSKDGFDKLAPGQSMAYDAQRSRWWNRNE